MKLNRTREEIVLLFISFVAAIAILPFLYFRFITANWIVVSFDLVLLVFFTMNGLYIYKTHKVTIPRMVLAGLALSVVLVGFYIKGASHIPWAYPSLVALFFAVKPNLAAKICAVSIVFSLVILFPTLNIYELFTFAVSLATTSVFAYAFAYNTDEQRKKLIKLSRRDHLTKLKNRRAFDEMLDEIVTSKRQQFPTSLIILDIDYFKDVNDLHGHIVGDEVLSNMSELIGKHLRVSDHFYRIGGEEFAIILENADLDNTFKISEKIRLAVEHDCLVEKIQITISLGIAQYLANESKEDWYTRADAALYKAKDEGRNTSRSAT